jgi:hypothetical protein
VQNVEAHEEHRLQKVLETTHRGSAGKDADFEDRPGLLHQGEVLKHNGFIRSAALQISKPVSQNACTNASRAHHARTELEARLSAVLDGLPIRLRRPSQQLVPDGPDLALRLGMTPRHDQLARVALDVGLFACDEGVRF